MVSTYTANKGLEQPAHGDYSGNWDVPLNTDMSLIDTAFGGSTSLNATAGSATLTVTQYRSLIFNISGSIGGNVTYTIPSGVGGSWIVNNTATGANVYFVSAAGGSSVLVSTGTVTVIYCDGTSNGMKSAGVSPNGSGASGTWNISINGNAATATTASSAAYATNAGNATTATNANYATTAGTATTATTATNANYATSAGTATTATTATTANNVAGGYVSAITAGSGISVNSTTGNVTISSSLKGLGLGGETWHSVTGSRAFGASYTNSYSYPIMINVVVANITTANYPSGNATLTVGGVTVSSTGFYNGGGQVIPLVAIVPPGASYNVTLNGGMLANLASWAELY